MHLASGSLFTQARQRQPEALGYLTGIPHRSPQSICQHQDFLSSARLILSGLIPILLFEKRPLSENQSQIRRSSICWEE